MAKEINGVLKPIKKIKSMDAHQKKKQDANVQQLKGLHKLKEIKENTFPY